MKPSEVVSCRSAQTRWHVSEFRDSAPTHLSLLVCWQESHDTGKLVELQTCVCACVWLSDVHYKSNQRSVKIPAITKQEQWCKKHHQMTSGPFCTTIVARECQRQTRSTSPKKSVTAAWPNFPQFHGHRVGKEHEMNRHSKKVKHGKMQNRANKVSHWRHRRLYPEAKRPILLKLTGKHNSHSGKVLGNCKFQKNSKECLSLNYFEIFF